MVGASKILTVSYGTFSCTLEGFDDPFNTMKAIAEYFRDLAADDRYFGAEPPQPDAAMLHRIAEREIQRRVEAKVQENSVILRAGDDVIPAPPSPPAPAPAPAFVAAPAPMMAEDSVAAKLSRIRSAVSAAAQAPAPKPHPVEAPVTILPPEREAQGEDWPDAVSDEFAHADAAPVAEPVQPAAEVEEASAEEIAVKEPVVEELAVEEAVVEETEESVVEDLMAEDVPLRTTEADALPEDLPQDAPDDWVEAGFDPGDMTALPADPEQDDETNAVFAPETPVADADEDEDMAALLARLGDETAATATDAPETAAPAVSQDAASQNDDEADGATLAETLAGTLAGISEKVEAVAGIAPAPALSEADYAEDLDAPDSLLPTFDDAASEDEWLAAEDEVMPEAAALAAAPLHPLSTDKAPEPAAEVEPEAPFVEAAADTDSAPELAEKVQRVRARVIKIRRIQPTTEAPDQGVPAAPEPFSEAAPENQPTLEAPRVKPVRPVRPIRVVAEARPQTSGTTADSTLSPEAEADLMRALEGLDFDAPSDRPPAAEAASVPARHPASTAQPEARAQRQTTPEDPVKRLLEETNTQLDVPENRRRLSAIAHLKAAVASTIADRRAGLSHRATDEERMDPYRSDLSRIVGPARPGTDAPSRPAPLVLVSEQRVDQLRPAPRPAEVEEPDFDEEDFDADAENIFADQDFADFAERLGAVTLADRLEAAAAWMAVVEGREGFTRPQLMRQAGETAESGIELREDALRGFGNLLRDGKIAKTRRGQYAVTEASHFLAEARKFQRRG